MNKLSDFKPLVRVDLPGLDDLDASGLILVVGPNSSGKSQFLHDVYDRIAGTPRSLVVATAVTLRKPDLEPFLSCLEREGLFTRIFDESGNAQLRPQTTYLGSGQAIGQIASSQPSQWHSGYNPSDPTTNRRKSEFQNYFGRLLVTGLFLERRLTAVGQTGTFDFETQPPQHDLHALYVDDRAKAELFAEIRASFGKAIWPDASRGNVLCLKVSDEGTLPSAEERLSPKMMAKYRAIETEGDGMKSYVATCIALLLGRRPVCILDEPEMCLHPPQAYNLGRFIGRYGSSADTVTFVASHSSHVLRGVIQTAPKMQIVRLTRRGASFEAHLVKSETLKEALAKPTVRAESILDGIFAQAVVVLEADTDRTVYQAVWESLHEEMRLDIHFAAVGGTGGIADTCQLYRTLRIPIAVVADLDVVVDTNKLKRMLAVLAPAEQQASLLEQATAIGALIKALPPLITAEEVRAQLQGALAGEMNWDAGDDGALRTQLAGTANALDRMKRLKRGGIASMPSEIAEPLKALLQGLASVGIFLVPVGELEEWLPAAEVVASKSSKWAWANEAAAKVREGGPQEGDVWGFMRGVAQYLLTSS